VRYRLRDRPCGAPSFAQFADFGKFRLRHAEALTAIKKRLPAAFILEVSKDDHASPDA